MENRRLFGRCSFLEGLDGLLSSTSPIKGSRHAPHALVSRALSAATAALVFGWLAYRAQWWEGDRHVVTYGLGLICGALIVDSLISTGRVLLTRTTARAGAASVGRALTAATLVVATGVCIFAMFRMFELHPNDALPPAHTFFDDVTQPSDLLFLAILVALWIAHVGPVALGGVFFSWLRQAMKEAGLSSAVAASVATLGATLAVPSWYVSRIALAPKLYEFLA